MIGKVYSKVSVLIWLLLAGMLLAFLVSHLKVVNDVGQFMPTANQNTQLRALMSELENGPSATTLMLRLYGDKPARLAELSMQLRKSLAEHQELFRTIQNGQDAFDWRASETLFPYRYLLADESSWSASSLRNSFNDRLQELRAGAGAVMGDVIVNDPQLAFIKYLQSLVDTSGVSKKHGVWFNSAGDNALLLISVRSQKLELDIMQAALTEINATYSKIASESGSNAKLEVAGPGEMAVATRTAIETAMRLVTWFMVVLLVVVFYIAYRSVRSLWLIAIPLLSAILIGLSATQIVFGEVHGIILVFGVTLLSVCVDYPLHLLSHIREDEPPFISMRRIWPTLRLGGISTVIAFLALLGSGFSGLSQLAIFAASGLTVALVITRYLLPAWLTLTTVRPRLWALSIRPGASLKLLLALAFIGLPLLVILQSDRLWETSIEAISPVPLAARIKDQTLRHELKVADVSHLFVQTGTELESVLVASDSIYQKLLRLKKNRLIGGVWSATQMLPPVERQRERQQSLPTEQQLWQNTSEALAGLPFKLAAFEPWVKSVVASRNLDPVSYDLISTTPLAQLLQQELFRQGNQWVSVIRIGGVKSEAELNAWIAAHPDVKSSHVQLRQATGLLLDEYRQATFERLTWVLLILGVIVLIWSRSLRRTVSIFVPVAAGLLAGAAMPILLGTGINVFHLLALLLVVGMGLDYSLFFNRIISDGLEVRQQFHAISISALTTATAFSVLAFSAVPVLSGIGQTVSIGILVCFLSSWCLATSHTPNPIEARA